VILEGIQFGVLAIGTMHTTTLVMLSTSNDQSQAQLSQEACTDMPQVQAASFICEEG
jgi:hypothetical protein